jgi:zinc-binding alcohol dehydrogenase/oxidoreductase
MMLRELCGPDKLRFEEVPDPAPGPGEVVVRLRNAAVNRRDLFITYGLYPGIALPSVPGSDGSGEVATKGEGTDGPEEGAAVVINPSLHWGPNPRAYGKQFSTLGVPVDGTLAQFVKVPAENVFPKPSHLSHEEAAAVPLSALTAYRALFTKGQVRAGETVLVPGVGGGVAAFLVQMASAVGATVFVTSGSEEKIRKAKALGAEDGVNYGEGEWSKKLRDVTGGVDLSVDSIGGEVFNALVTVAKPGSRIVTFGATAGPVPKLVMPKIFLKQLDVLGTSMGTNEEFGAMLRFWERYHLRPVIDRRYALNETVDALKRMEAGTGMGKLVLGIDA